MSKPEDCITFETFRQLGYLDIKRMVDKEPSCFNGLVNVRKYKVTIELVDEPVEVIHERLKKIWREAASYHHMQPIKNAAEKYGLTLDVNDFRSAVNKV